MCSSVTIVGGLIDLQQLIHAAVVERLQVFFPSLIIRTAVLDPECFLLGNSVLKIGAIHINNIQLFRREHTVNRINGRILDIRHPEIVQISQTLNGTIFHLKDVAVVAGKDELRTGNLKLSLQFACALSVFLAALGIGKSSGMSIRRIRWKTEAPSTLAASYSDVSTVESVAM